MNKISALPNKIGVVLSYIICINVCAFARNSLQLIFWYGFSGSYQSAGLVLFFNVMAFSIMFWCGCLTGFLIHKKTVLHASLAVALGVIFAYLISKTNLNDYILILQGTLIGIVLGGAGGGCALIARKFLRSKYKI